MADLKVSQVKSKQLNSYKIKIFPVKITRKNDNQKLRQKKNYLIKCFFSLMQTFAA